MIYSIPNGGFIEIPDSEYWSLTDEELKEFELKAQAGYFKMDDTDPLYAEREIPNDLDLSPED